MDTPIVFYALPSPEPNMATQCASVMFVLRDTNCSQMEHAHHQMIIILMITTILTTLNTIMNTITNKFTPHLQSIRTLLNSTAHLTKSTQPMDLSAKTAQVIPELFQIKKTVITILATITQFLIQMEHVDGVDIIKFQTITKDLALPFN